MKRIFVDAHVFDEGFQGSRTYVKGLYTEILKMNSDKYEFFFGANDVENLKKEFFPFTNFKAVKYKFKNRYFRLLIDFPLLFLKHKIDIGHFQYISSPIKLTKEIITTHDILFVDFPELFPSKYKFLRTWLFRSSAKRANLLMTDSEFSKHSIHKHFNIPLDKIINTLCGVSSDFLAKSQTKDLPDIKTKYELNRFILFVSRVEPRKNHVSLIQSYRELNLAEHGYSLVFVGKFDLEYPELNKCLAGLSPKERKNIRFIEAQQQELYSFYKYCDLFVYPSLAEGFGLPPLEAVLSGSTVLCSNKTSMSEYSFLGDKLFSPDQPGELSRKIGQFVGAEKDIERIERERSYILSKYNWRAIANKFLSEIDKLEYD